MVRRNLSIVSEGDTLSGLVLVQGFPSVVGGPRFWWSENERIRDPFERHSVVY